jgi:hypothetical protein
VVLQRGGYGNVVFNLVFLLQVRISKLFSGEDFNDEQFCHYFLRLFDLLLVQESLVKSPIRFSEALADLVASASSLKFTKHGVRIGAFPSFNQKRPRSNEVSFRIRNSRGNLSAGSHFAQAPPAPEAAKSGLNFSQQYKRLEKEASEKVTLLNPHLVEQIGRAAPSRPSRPFSGATGKQSNRPKQQVSA